VPAGPGAGRALDFEKERALRALGRAPHGPAERLPISAQHERSPPAGWQAGIADARPVVGRTIHASGASGRGGACSASCARSCCSGCSS
jgi:hypothetical protein